MKSKGRQTIVHAHSPLVALSGRVSLALYQAKLHAFSNISHTASHSRLCEQKLTRFALLFKRLQQESKKAALSAWQTNLMGLTIRMLESQQGLFKSSRRSYTKMSLQQNDDFQMRASRTSRIVRPSKKKGQVHNLCRMLALLFNSCRSKAFLTIRKFQPLKFIASQSFQILHQILCRRKLLALQGIANHEAARRTSRSKKVKRQMWRNGLRLLKNLFECKENDQKYQSFNWLKTVKQIVVEQPVSQPIIKQIPKKPPIPARSASPQRKITLTLPTLPLPLSLPPLPPPAPIIFVPLFPLPPPLVRRVSLSPRLHYRGSLSPPRRGPMPIFSNTISSFRLGAGRAMCFSHLKPPCIHPNRLQASGPNFIADFVPVYKRSKSAYSWQEKRAPSPFRVAELISQNKRQSNIRVEVSRTEFRPVPFNGSGRANPEQINRQSLGNVVSYNQALRALDFHNKMEMSRPSTGLYSMDYQPAPIPQSSHSVYMSMSRHQGKWVGTKQEQIPNQKLMELGRGMTRGERQQFEHQKFIRCQGHRFVHQQPNNVQRNIRALRDMSRDVYRVSRDAPRVSSRDAPRVPSRDVPRITPRDVPRVTPRDVSRVALRDIAMIAQKNTPSISPRALHRDKQSSGIAYRDGVNFERRQDLLKGQREERGLGRKDGHIRINRLQQLSRVDGSPVREGMSSRRQPTELRMSGLNWVQTASSHWTKDRQSPREENYSVVQPFSEANGSRARDSAFI